MADIRFRVDEAAMGQLQRQLVVPEMRRVGNRLLNLARQEVPVDEGRLRASLAMDVVEVGGRVTVRVGTSLEYGLYVHEGTGVYAGRGPIRPKGGSVLRWPAKNNSGAGRRRYKSGSTGGYMYARQVRGQRPNPYLVRALDRLVL